MTLHALEGSSEGFQYRGAKRAFREQIERGIGEITFVGYRYFGEGSTYC
jgi:hypothetical protein